MRRKAKPDLIGAGLAEKTENRGWFLLSPLRRQVNEIRMAGLLFGRGLILDGLAGLGWPWSHRLSLWIDALDQAAEELRDRQGERA